MRQTRARLVDGTEGISELTDLEPQTLHLVRRGANGYRPLAAKAKRGQSSLAAACRAAGIDLPAKSLPPDRAKPRDRRQGVTARLTVAP